MYIVASSVSSSYLLGLATYVYNDFTDFQVDKINKTNRPSIKDRLTKRHLITTVCIMFTIGLGLTASINFHAFIVSIIFVALGIFYSHPKFKLKDKFLLKTLITGTGAGLLSLLGGMAVMNTSPSIIYTAFSFFIFYFILSPLGDIGDINGDRAVGRRTFPIVFGIEKTLLIMLSVPFVISLLTVSSYSILHMNMVGVFAVIATSIAIIATIMRLHKSLMYHHEVKSFRHKMRFLNITMQIAMLLAFL